MDQDPKHWPVDQKIDTYLHSGWHGWGEYLDDNIAVARFVLDALPHAGTQEERNRQMLAIRQWLVDSGAEMVETHRHADGAINLRFHMLNQPGQGLDPELTSASLVLTPGQATALGPVDETLYQQVLAAERHWVQTAPGAPVIKAFFVGEEETESGDHIQPADANDDGVQCRWEWDSTAAIMDLPPGERTGAMERDTYESDNLRDHEDAPEETRDWDGPYKVEAIVFKPSTPLMAYRQARALDQDTSVAGGSTPRPRI